LEDSFTYSRNTGGRVLRMTATFNLLKLGFRLSNTVKSCCIYFEQNGLQVKMNKSDQALSAVIEGQQDWIFSNKKVSNQDELIELLKQYE